MELVSIIPFYLLALTWSIEPFDTSCGQWPAEVKWPRLQSLLCLLFAVLFHNVWNSTLYRYTAPDRV